MSGERSPGPDAIRVLVADNTRIHTQLLSDELRRDPRLAVISASQPSNLVETAVREQARIAVISSNLEEEPQRGLSVLRELRSALPHIVGVILLDSVRREMVIEAFQAGARGILSRDESLENLGKCVHRVHEGLIWASSEQMVFAIEALASAPSVRPALSNGLDLLSKREMDVVRCLADGLTNREIAERLRLSQHTIKNYLFRVFDKLGVSSRMELMFLTLSQPPGRNNQGGSGGDRGYASPANLRDCEEAAENGMAAAQLALAQMYSEGKGTRRDPVAAYTWYLISERSHLELKEVISAAKRRLADQLSADQIVTAQRRAAEKLKKPAKAAFASSVSSSD